MSKPPGGKGALMDPFNDSVFREDVHVSLSMAIAFLVTTLSISGDCWEIETVDTGNRRFADMTEQSLVVDSLGNPHMAYGADHLYYTWFDGSRWHYEIADDGDLVGRCASLALDGAGHPHICYFDSVSSTLNYAVKSSMGWSISVVDTVGDYGGAPSIEVDGGGEPHLAYCDQEDNALAYASLEGSVWVFEVVDSNALGGGALEFDQNGQPHIGYTGDAEFRYAWRDADGWHIESVGNEDAIDFWISIEVDDSGRSHATWCSAGGENEGVYYGFKDNTGWHTEVIAEYSTYFTSLELDGESYPHVTYFEYGGLKYSFQDASGWHEETVDPSIARSASLALSDFDRAHITYKDLSDGQLRYAKRDGVGWETATIDWAHGPVGFSSSMVLDTCEAPHIAYGDLYRSMSICYAFRTSDPWRHEMIAPGASSLSLALDQANLPRIAYYDNWTPDWAADLEYASLTDSGWQIQTVISEGNNGAYCSLEIDGESRPHISFAGWVSEGFGLMHATTDGNDWIIEDTETPWEWPGATSLGLDSLGFPHIAADERYGGGLRYVHKSQAGWTIEVIDDDEYVGSDVSLALDPFGRVHVAYGDDSQLWDRDLKYARKDASGWTVDVVDSIGHVGFNPSLAIDAAGNPHISYAGGPSGGTNQDLKYAFLSPMGWHIEIVDTTGNTGGYSSLAIDSQGRPHISYYCETNGVLKCAVKEDRLELVLSGTLLNGALTLQWAPAVGSECWIFGASNYPFFVPGMAPGYDFRIAILPSDIASWQSSAGVGFPEDNWTYLVIAVDETETELGRSNRVGELDFPTDTP